jgi:hypothetical protein
MSWQARHKNVFSAFGTWSCHKLRHTLLVCARLEPSATYSSSRLFWRWYALLTENTPAAVPPNINLSSCSVWLMGIDWIFKHSSLEKIRSNNGQFHHLRSTSISWSTMAVEANTAGGEITLFVVELGIHLSSHIWTALPFPILHNSPSRTKSLDPWMLLQAKECFFP